jgi:hypothetical protein
MNEPATLGAYLRRERERRGVALRAISESTKVSVGLFEGLEADDISRWPGGIFRRAFVRSYAQCVGLDPDEIVKRFERQHAPADAEPLIPGPISGAPTPALVAVGANVSHTADAPPPPRRARVVGTAADLTVALVLAFGSAAAGSRLLWPVLLIASYYAVGILLTGTSPMVALLGEDRNYADPRSASPTLAESPASGEEQLPPMAVVPPRPQPRRAGERSRQRRGAAARA